MKTAPPSVAAHALLTELRRHTVHTPPPPPAPDWTLPALAGGLVELSGSENSAGLSWAFQLVLDAQERGEPVAWLMTGADGFFPPDAADTGVDLDALVVVRLAEARRLARAADVLLRSGAFGLVVIDLAEAPVPIPVQTRLAGVAQKHASVVLFLTRKDDESPSLGSLVGVRAQARRERLGEAAWSCTLHVLKDKRRGPGWRREERMRGPAGLR
ncbi:MAG: recombinase A [Proteobacteria bacterium]|nr:recombinase A [Pseudomonadota bacterium]